MLLRSKLWNFPLRQQDWVNDPLMISSFHPSRGKKKKSRKRRDSDSSDSSESSDSSASSSDSSSSDESDSDDDKRRRRKKAKKNKVCKQKDLAVLLTFTFSPFLDFHKTKT